jgi:hypothetical protein
MIQLILLQLSAPACLLAGMQQPMDAQTMASARDFLDPAHANYSLTDLAWETQIRRRFDCPTHL